MAKNSLTSFVSNPPGLTLKAELKKRGIKQKDFAEQIGMRPSHLNEMIKGKRPISKYMADKLETALGISSDFWMRQQASYDYEVALREYNYEGEELHPSILREPTGIQYGGENSKAYEMGYHAGRKSERESILSALKTADIDISLIKLPEIEDVTV